LLGATLDTTSSIEGWMGVAGAPSVEVIVADEPSPLPPALDAEKALTFARWDASRGAFDEALAAVDDLLARQPGLAAALAYRAEILELSGKDSEALAAYEVAMTAFLEANPDPAEWPSELQQSLDALQEKLVIDGPVEEARFRRGDANADGTINISDPIAALGYLFLGNPRSLVCQRSADTDDSGAVNITDAVYLLQHLFLGGAAPPPPFASCGLDETTDSLPCATQAACKQ
jgi:tetratricopeptide (TPR) repeat protein